MKISDHIKIIRKRKAQAGRHRRGNATKVYYVLLFINVNSSTSGLKNENNEIDLLFDFA